MEATKNCRIGCPCIVCKLRKKFDDKHDIQGSVQKLRNLYGNFQITKKLKEYTEEIDDIYGKNFQKIQKRFDNSFHKLVNFIHFVEEKLDANFILEKHRMLCFDLLLCITELKHYLDLEKNFMEDRLNISMNDFVSLQDKIRFLEKQKEIHSQRGKINSNTSSGILIKFK